MKRPTCELTDEQLRFGDPELLMLHATSLAEEALDRRVRSKASKLWRVDASFSYSDGWIRHRAHRHLALLADEQQAAIQHANLWLCERYHGIVWDGDITATEIPDGVVAI